MLFRSALVTWAASFCSGRADIGLTPIRLASCFPEYQLLGRAHRGEFIFASPLVRFAGVSVDVHTAAVKAFCETVKIDFKKFEGNIGRIWEAAAQWGDLLDRHIIQDLVAKKASLAPRPIDKEPEAEVGKVADGLTLDEATAAIIDFQNKTKK